MSLTGAIYTSIRKEKGTSAFFKTLESFSLTENTKKLFKVGETEDKSL